MIDETIENWVFPWTKSSKPTQSERVRRKLTKLLDHQRSSLEERAALYFRTPPEDYRARANLASPEVTEYEICSVMWDKFGIPPHVLEHLDANWVDSMLIVLSEDVKAENDRSRRA
jgi:t-SNARE complex subunit (syntaxin)